MSITTSEGQATISTTEWSIAFNAAATTSNNMSTPGVYQVFIDFSALTSAGYYEVIIYESAMAGTNGGTVLSSVTMFDGPTMSTPHANFSGVKVRPTSVA